MDAPGSASYDRPFMITWITRSHRGKGDSRTGAGNPPRVTGFREYLANGTIIDWSDKPGAKEKGSVTKLSNGLEEG
jgi:hypothetical protein